MTGRLYYVDLNGGITDSSLPEIRKVAIDYLLSHPELDSVEVFKPYQPKQLLGTVEYYNNVLFQWKTAHRTIKLNSDGTHGKRI